MTNPTTSSTQDFAALNKRLNAETQELADKIVNETATERDKNRLASIIYPKLKFFIFKFFNNNDHTEEALNNVMEKIFKNISQYNNKWRFTTWIYNIAKNEALLFKDKLRKERTVEMDSVSFFLNSVDDSKEALDLENGLQLLYQVTITEIMSMPDSLEKDILIDTEINRMKGAAISIKHNMNLNTVKTKLRKARRTIREAIIEKYPEIIESVADVIEYEKA